MSDTARSTQAWRPQFHFSPHRNWINDPNGLVWLDGEYHLFFQYNPHGSLWGHMSWGHAVSTDLLNWTELPVALPEDERAMVFSGSVVVDHQNRSGLGDGHAPVMVACYTACLHPPAQRQVQDLAYSQDRGRTWQRFEGNPVLDIGLKDFRDPKVLWHEASGQWVMVVVVPDLRQARFYGSPNLRQWSELSRFEAPFEGQGIWECPDLIELPCQEGGTMWMLKVDAFGGHPSGETGARVFFGHFDGRRFHAEPEDAPQWADHGSDFYAALSWSNLPQQPWKGKAVWLAWMNCHRYAAAIPTAPWRGAMTLPRTLHARRVDGRWRLVQAVVPAVEGLRGLPHEAAALSLAANQADALMTIEGQGACAEVHWTVHEAQAGAQALLRIVIDAPIDTKPVDAEPPGRLAPWPQEVLVGYDAARQEVFIDRSRSGFIPMDDARYAGRRSQACRAPAPDRPLRLQLWIDRGSVEVIADEGLVSLTEQVLPVGGRFRIERACMHGGAHFGPAQAWPLRAATF